MFLRVQLCFTNLWGHLEAFIGSLDVTLFKVYINFGGSSCPGWQCHFIFHIKCFFSNIYLFFPPLVLPFIYPFVDHPYETSIFIFCQLVLFNLLYPNIFYFIYYFYTCNETYNKDVSSKKTWIILKLFYQHFFTK